MPPRCPTAPTSSLQHLGLVQPKNTAAPRSASPPRGSDARRSPQCPPPRRGSRRKSGLRSICRSSPRSVKKRVSRAVERGNRLRRARRVLRKTLFRRPARRCCSRHRDASGTSSSQPLAAAMSAFSARWFPAYSRTAYPARAIASGVVLSSRNFASANIRTRNRAAACTPVPGSWLTPSPDDRFTFIAQASTALSNNASWGLPMTRTPSLPAGDGIGPR